MTASSVNGNGRATRSGARALGLLGIPLNGTILQALAEGPRQLVELRSECGSPAQTTLRAHLKELEEVGAIVKRRGSNFPGIVECELTQPGHELLFVVSVVESWLRDAPQGPLAFGSSAGRAAIRALVEGWSSAMLRALAARPLSLTQLDGIIGSLSYPALERRLIAMRLAGQVEVCSAGGGTTPHRVTEWLRRGVGPLAAAARWERRHLPDATPPIAPIDTEAGFLLALPLLRLPAELSGSCRMGVEMAATNEEHRLAGAIAEVADGRVVSCTVRLNGTADSWAIGSASAWLHAVVGSDTDRLELGGDQGLARALLDGLHTALFDVPSRIDFRN